MRSEGGGGWDGGSVFHYYAFHVTTRDFPSGNMATRGGDMATQAGNMTTWTWRAGYMVTTIHLEESSVQFCVILYDFCILHKNKCV